jgi:hypothetical protein
MIKAQTLKAAGIGCNQNITSHSKGQKTVGFCSFVAYFNQLIFAS